MKILMISMYFEQDNIIGSIRPTNFANWLASFGHQVDVITNNPEAGKKANGNLRVYSFHAGLKAQSNENIKRAAKKNARSPFNHSIFNGLRTHIFEWKRSFLWSSSVLKQFTKAITSNITKLKTESPIVQMLYVRELPSSLITVKYIDVIAEVIRFI